MLATYTEGYIWDTDCFFINELRDAYPSPSYTGTFNVGESIDDEWFIVSLLQKMSKSFRDFFISVHDIDGEFLLIEVADLIPRHLQPENTSNRVWLHGGELHIIEDKLTVPNTDAAIRLIATNPGTTVAHASIQDRINERLRRAEAYKEKQLHRAQCHLPRRVAECLLVEPQLVSAAVRAFWERDPITLQTVSRQPFFSKVGTNDFVATGVTMTRNFYARIRAQPALSLPWRSSSIDEKDVGPAIWCGFELAHSLRYSLRSSGCRTDITDNQDFPTACQNALEIAMRDNIEVPDTLAGDFDRDDWLYLPSPADVQECSSRPVASEKEDDNDTFTNMAKRVSQFLNETADVEGAFFSDHSEDDESDHPSESYSHAPDHDDASDNSGEYYWPDKEALDPQAFLDASTRLLKPNDSGDTSLRNHDDDSLSILSAMAAMDHELRILDPSQLAAKNRRSSYSPVSQERTRSEDTATFGCSQDDLDANLISNLMNAIDAQDGVGSASHTLLTTIHSPEQSGGPFPNGGSIR